MTSADPGKAVQDGLRRFLLSQLPGVEEVQISGVRRSGGGSSRENWAFDACWNQAGQMINRQLLMRRDPPSSVVDTGRNVEFGLLRALAETDVATPEACWLDAEGRWLERPMMVVARCRGRADRAVLRDVNPLHLAADERLSLARELVDVLASVHSIDIEATGISTVLPPPEGDPASSEISRWERELDDLELEPYPALRLALVWLRQHQPPAPSRLALVHGDFRPANVLVEEGAIEVLLDWELARIGDPLDDLGWYCAPLYRREHFLPDRWQQADFLRRYTEQTGTPVDSEHLKFWQIMATFRLAVMAVSGVRSFCEGNSDRPSAPAEAIAARVLADALASTSI